MEDQLGLPLASGLFRAQQTSIVEIDLEMLRRSVKIAREKSQRN